MSQSGISLSIALCTYNGARFLKAQLESFRAQTALPKELVVCDDNSTDESRQIVEEFARSAPFEVLLHHQPQRLGWKANREDCYRRCRGSLIAASDQDDVWMPTKLARMAKALEASPQCLLAFNDCEVVDEALQPLGYRVLAHSSLNEEREKQILNGESLRALLPNTPIAEAAMVFRASLLQAALPIPAEWLPDEWLCIVAAATGGCTIVPEPLQFYRQHHTNLLGARRKSALQKYREAKDGSAAEYFLRQERHFEVLRDRLARQIAEPGGPAPLPGAIELVEHRLAFTAARRRMRQHPLQRPWIILRELSHGNYHRMGTGWRTVLYDLLI